MIFVENKVGLVLEGGAMRGLYTAGVLDFLLKKDISLPYIAAVSAGACQAFSYISKQRGRNKKVTMDYIADSRYLSMRNVIKEGGPFGFSFMFGDIVRELVPFDFETFEQSEQELAIGATNCITGEIQYFYKSKTTTEELFKACTASSSMPLAAKEVVINKIPYLDGGVADSIPIQKAIEDGYHKNIIILTRNKGYYKEPAHYSLLLARAKYKNYIGLLKALQYRHKKYNDTINFVEKLEADGKAIIIRPSTPVVVKRLEKDKKKLLDFYKQGYFDIKSNYERIKDFIKN